MSRMRYVKGVNGSPYILVHNIKHNAYNTVSSSMVVDNILLPFATEAI